MSRKDRIDFRHSVDFESLDEELASAMDALDDTNSRIAELLTIEKKQEELPGLDRVSGEEGTTEPEDPDEDSPAT